MKKPLLALSIVAASSLSAQFFSTGTVTLGSSGMTVKMVTSSTNVTLTLTGTSTGYLGLGFGGTGNSGGMASGVDGFIYNSNSTTNSNLDYTFAGIGATPNADPSQDWTITSNTTNGGMRTIVATRSLAGGSGDTAFTNSNSSINIFYAVGPSLTLQNSYHSARGYAVLTRNSVLGTNDIATENKAIALYPNPARETVNFKNADKIKSVEIYETTGRKVKSVELKSSELTVAELSAGTYYLELQLKDGTKAYEKLIKE